MGKRRMWKISLLYWVSKGKGSENVWTDKFYCLIYLHSFRHGQRLLSSYRLKQSLSPSMCFSTSVCVCVCEAPYWLLMVKSPWSERWGLEWQPGDGANGGSERWRDGGCLKNGGRRLRSNPINWGNCAERMLERGGGGWRWACKGEKGRNPAFPLLSTTTSLW